jgi:superfamily II DNA or RNA helicase
VDQDKQIILSTFQSLTNAKTKPDVEFFHQFKYVVFDEVHTCVAKTCKWIMDNCINANYRVGMTGTLSDAKANEMVLIGIFGPVKQVITTAELMEQGKVAALRIHAILLKHPAVHCKLLRSSPKGEDGKREKFSYPEEMEFIVNSAARNRFIMSLTAKLKGNTILMINQIEHGELLYETMKRVLPDRDIYLYNGSTNKDDREEIRQLMETKENAIIIGSLGVLSTGISIKRLHNMVFSHPSKSRVKVLQSVGRLLRVSKFGNEVVMYDIIDDFSIGAYENYVLEHGKKRVEFYMNQKFNVETERVELAEPPKLIEE